MVSWFLKNKGERKKTNQEGFTKTLRIFGE